MSLSSWGLDNFKNAMDAAGLSTRDAVIPDGRLHRFRVNGDKADSRNGWYVLYGDGVPAGSFGCWKRGVSQTWCVKTESVMTLAERREFARRMRDAREAREIENTARKKEAARKAAAIWKAAPIAPDSHPYLKKKAVRSHGLRLYKNALVVPLRDAAGTPHSLQFIDSGGHKRFLSGGQIAGCYYPIGTLSDTLCVCEGYATAASVHEATGYAVAVAFNCGNLLAVSQVLRLKFPDAKLVLCADNDTQTDGNPGLTKAREAAAAVGALLAVPPCHGDFNDLLHGGTP